MANGFPTELFGDAADNIEAMATDIGGLLQSPNAVAVRELPEAGNKIDVGIIGLASVSGWFDMSVTLRSYNSAVTFEIQVDYETSDGLPPEFRFFVAESDTGQITGEMAGVDGTDFLYSERVNANLTHASIPATIKGRFRHRVSIQPRASFRLAAEAIPTSGTITTAAVHIWATGVELLS